MSKMILLHNARCSKSRIGLAHLQDRKADFEVREYLKEELSTKELITLFKALGGNPLESGALRKGEADFKANFKGKTLSLADWAEAVLTYPKLLERPILIKGDKAVIGRPAEAFDALL
ncbi:MAG: arsenate reductase [Flavobacteriales bacterium]|jgi:arsenate reductase